MDSLRILIIEDQLITATDICETLEKSGHVVTAIARNTQEAIASVIKNPPDLALIDIQLDGATDNGIETARKLLIYHAMPIIYLTANSESLIFEEAKKTMPAAYLLKPFRNNELTMQIELAYYNYLSATKDPDKTQTSDSLFLPIKKGYKKILKNDVVYLQANGSYVNIFMIQEEIPHLLTMNLGYLAQYFSTPNFYRLSRSVLINMNHLERIEGNQLFMHRHPYAIPIPEGSRMDLLKQLAVVRTR
ncbi:response regulator [Larkinella bovis]|uniref:Response regulator n=1 Tax=Larkinella bovis TaxID=683041 RepID=A0ABW0IL50_9BACT